jgi:hypothetical protein
MNRSIDGLESSESMANITDPMKVEKLPRARIAAAADVPVLPMVRHLFSCELVASSLAVLLAVAMTLLSLLSLSLLRTQQFHVDLGAENSSSDELISTMSESSSVTFGVLFKRDGLLKVACMIFP